jgi:ribosome biogenesis protein SSF1/2
MHGFGQQEESKTGEAARIVSVLLQSVFPPINVHSLNLSQCKRVVLFALSQGQKEGENPGPLRVEFRHYEISTRQRNVNKAVTETTKP